MSQRYSSRLRRGRWTRGGASKKEALSGAGYDIEKTQVEEEERWKQLEHAVALAVNYYQMRPVDNEYSKDITGIISDRARKNYARISGGADEDYSIIMMLRGLPRSDIDSCILPPQMKMPTPSFANMGMDNFMEDDMFGPQEEEVEDAAATAAAAEAELNEMDGLIPYNFGQQEEELGNATTDDNNNDTSYEEMMAQIFLFNGTPMTMGDPNAAAGGGSNDD